MTHDQGQALPHLLRDVTHDQCRTQMMALLVNVRLCMYKSCLPPVSVSLSPSLHSPTLFWTQGRKKRALSMCGLDLGLSVRGEVMIFVGLLVLPVGRLLLTSSSRPTGSLVASHCIGTGSPHLEHQVLMGSRCSQVAWGRQELMVVAWGEQEDGSRCYVCSWREGEQEGGLSVLWQQRGGDSPLHPAPTSCKPRSPLAPTCGNGDPASGAQFPGGCIMCDVRARPKATSETRDRKGRRNH